MQELTFSLWEIWVSYKIYSILGVCTVQYMICFKLPYIRESPLPPQKHSAMGSWAPASVWQHHHVRNFHTWVPLGKCWGHNVKISITAVQKGGVLLLAPDTVVLNIIWCFLPTICSRSWEDESSSSLTSPPAVDLSVVTPWPVCKGQTHWHFGSIFTTGSAKEENKTAA